MWQYEGNKRRGKRGNGKELKNIKTFPFKTY
jgi:hypothetical protein